MLRVGLLRSVLFHAGKSIPGLAAGKYCAWMVLVLNASIGATEAVISSFVIPFLAERLTSRRGEDLSWAGRG